MLYLPGTSWYHESQVFNWFHTRHSLWLLSPSDRVPSQVQKLDGTRTIGAIPRRKICQEDVCHWKNHLFQCASSKFFKYQSVSQRDVSWFRRKGLCITVHVHIIYIISIHFTSTFLSCVVICSILPNHIWLYHTPVFAGQTGSQCHPGSVHVRSGCWGLDHGR